MRVVMMIVLATLSAAPAAAQGAASETEMRELVTAAKATAEAVRESVDYARVTPDLLTQILAKLDRSRTSSTRSRTP